MTKKKLRTIQIRNVDPQLHHALRLRAARDDSSVEAVAREILRDAVGGRIDGPGLLTLVDHAFDEGPDVEENELDIPTRGTMRPLPDFHEP